VCNGQALVVEELDRARVRQIGDVDGLVDLEQGDIGGPEALGLSAGEALDLDLAQHMLQNASLVLTPTGTPIN